MVRNFRGPRRERWLFFVVALLAAGFCEQVHHQFVDRGSYFGGGHTNSQFQIDLQRHVIALNANALPHSYRFLSHGILAVFEWLSGGFDFARATFRLVCNVLLMGAILRYARLFLGPVMSVGVLLLFVLQYPITVAWYAGQPVDPLSHLSFIACLYCLATRQEAGIGPSLVVGAMAKESVAALAVARAFYGENRVRAAVLALVYFGAALSALAVVRYWVNGGTFSYSRISGVGTNHLWANLKGIHAWGPQYVFTLGILAPGAWLGWRLMDRSFRLTCLFLVLALVGSSALFSWLSEVRNLVPAMIMLLIVNARWLEQRFVNPAASRVAGAATTAVPQSAASA